MIGEEEGKKIEKKLSDMGLFSKPEIPEISLEDGRTTYGFGYPIKALEKFLGYYDPELHIPYNPSISFNTDFSLCQCTCTYSKGRSRDTIIFDGAESEEYASRAQKALNIFRSISGVSGSFKFVIERSRRYGKAKGLSESAAVAAAVSRALLRNVFGKDPDERIISRFAKFVSGSGTRSSIPGFSMWLSYPGIREDGCFAVRLPVKHSNFHFAAIPLYTDVRTSDMHRLVVGSPLYMPWITGKFQRLDDIIEAGFRIEHLMQRGFEEMINLSNLVKSIGREIHTPDTLTVIEKYIEFRRKGGNVYMTTDTGPSTVIMSSDRSELEEFLSLVPFEHIYGNVMDARDPDSMQEFVRKATEKYNL